MTVYHTLCILIHSFGIYLLISLHRSKHQTVHSILTMNLSIVEMVINIERVIFFVPMLIFLNHNQHNLLQLYIDKYCSVIRSINFYGLFHILYLAMVLLAVNRLLGAVYPIKYRIYATKGKLKYLLLCCWILGIVLTVVSLICDWRTKFIYFVDLILLIVLLVISVKTYLLIFKALVKSKRQFSRTTSSPENIGLFKIFRNSRLYTSALTVISFFFCWGIPVCLYVISSFLRLQSEEVMYVCEAIISINYICDAFIYIYVDNDVHKLMYRKLHVMKSTCIVRWTTRSQGQPWTTRSITPNKGRCYSCQ